MIDIFNKKLFLFDMDGTIYKDNNLFPGVKEVLKKIIANGGKYVFLTNNSSKSVDDYVLKIKNLGIDVNEDNFFTSSQATILYLKENKLNDKLIYVLGTESLKKELITNNIKIIDKYSEDIDLVLVGFDTELNYKKLVDVCHILINNIPLIATNPDLVCPTTFGFVPDCGSICQMIYNSTGKKPIIIGKPNKEMIDMILKKEKVLKEDTVIIGDRLYTDIASGNNSGVDTICVLTGEATKEEIKKSHFKPTIVLNSVGDMFDYLK